jgi:hypothetical protein
MARKERAYRMTDHKAKSTGGAKDPDEITKPANATPGSSEPTGQAAEAPAPGQESDQYVMTINRATGDVLKIERMDESGKKEELSEEEYQSIFGSPGMAAADLSGAGVDDPSVQAYYQGIADAEAALQSGMGYDDSEAYSPEELAYYQALSDYDSYLSGGWMGEGSGYEGYSAEELAYCQGIEDYQASLG